MKRLAMVVLAVVILASTSWAQGRLTRNPDGGSADTPRRPGPTVNSSVPMLSSTFAGKPMKLIASAVSIEDMEVEPDDINADEKHHAFSTLSITVPADPGRTYLYTCAATSGFWQQLPSDSPLMISAILLVRFDTPLVDGGVFYQGYDIPERRREFEPSTKKVNHTPLPSGCGVVDQAQLAFLFTTQMGMSDADALALAQQVIRSSMKLSVGFNVRMQSVSTFGLSDPALQVWSD